MAMPATAASSSYMSLCSACDGTAASSFVIPVMQAMAPLHAGEGGIFLPPIMQHGASSRRQLRGWTRSAP